MSDKRAVFIHSPSLKGGGYPSDCPFNTLRADKTRQTLFTMGLLSGPGRREVPPLRATREELETFHTPRYLDMILRAEAGDLSPEAFAMGLGTPDCPVSKGMTDYFSWAAGATLTGARMILAGEADIAFNPSGGFHHAGPEKAAGFCFVNDIVLAAMLFARHGKRVLVLDLDVHHGDGVQDAFYERDDVMVISLHETGETLFPGTGRENEIGSGPGLGYTVNIPFPMDTHDEAYEKAFDIIVPPLMATFAPDVILLELGMDALANDPLAHLSLSNNVYVDLIHRILKQDRPILATGGGGYHVRNTVRGWALAWSVLCGDDQYDLSMGMGGVMLETVEWSGGLRDRTVPVDLDRQLQVNTEVNRTIERLRRAVFPIHGLS